MKLLISLILGLAEVTGVGNRKLSVLSNRLIQGIALASGILGLLTALIPFIGLVLPVVAVVLGSIAIAMAGDQPRQIAVVSLAFGLVGILVNLIVLLWLFG